MPSFNKITIVGHLGKDPELRHTPQGVAVCEFSIATNHKKDEEATWFRVTAWRNIAENVSKFLKKGSVAYFSGVLHAEKWEGRDGKQGTTLVVNADDVKFLSAANSFTETTTAKPEAFAVAQAQADAAFAPKKMTQEEIDEIPF
jgi:single-strand DNA-binding protein